MSKKSLISPLSPPIANCGTCFHWQEALEAESKIAGVVVKDFGFCLRYPPRLVDPSELTTHGPSLRFGLTRRSVYCGEHSPR